MPHDVVIRFAASYLAWNGFFFNKGLVCNSNVPNIFSSELRSIEKMSSAEHISRVRQLYKLIFRVHRALPAELRVLGDNYARDEFKRHKQCNPEEARIFMNEWTDYAINLARQMKPLQQAKKKEVGRYLDPRLLDHMTDEQLCQLYELHKAAALEEEGKEEKK